MSTPTADLQATQAVTGFSENPLLVMLGPGIRHAQFFCMISACLSIYVATL